MNERTTHKRPAYALKCKLQPLVPDKRLASVENICALLIESRFGPGRVYELVADLRQRPDGGSDTFLFVTAEGLTPAYEIGIVQDALLDAIEADLAFSRREIEIKNQATQNFSPSTLARGSPTLPNP